MKTSYLFIGGVRDGQHIEIDRRIDVFSTLVPLEFSPTAPHAGEFNDEPYEINTYHKMWVESRQVFALNRNPSPLIDRYPLAGTINVNLEDLETILETCEPPMIPTARPRFDLAVRRLYTALSNHNKQKDTDP